MADVLADQMTWTTAIAGAQPASELHAQPALAALAALVSAWQMVSRQTYQPRSLP